MLGPWIKPHGNGAEYEENPPVIGSILELSCYDDFEKDQGTCFVRVEGEEFFDGDHLLHVSYLAIQDDYYAWWVENVRPKEDGHFISTRPWGQAAAIRLPGREADEQVEASRVYAYRSVYGSGGLEGATWLRAGSAKLTKVKVAFAGYDDDPEGAGRDGRDWPSEDEEEQDQQHGGGGPRESITLRDKSGLRPAAKARAASPTRHGNKLFSVSRSRTPPGAAGLAHEMRQLRDRLQRSPPPERRGRKEARPASRSKARSRGREEQRRGEQEDDQKTRSDRRRGSGEKRQAKKESSAERDTERHDQRERSRGHE